MLPTPDDKYLCAVDNGVDHVKIYKINEQTGRINLYDILRCKLDSGPRLLTFSNDGRFAYINCELTMRSLYIRMTAQANLLSLRKYSRYLYCVIHRQREAHAAA